MNGKEETDNHDGKIDIVVGNVEAPSTIYFNDGSGRHYTPIHFGDNKGAAYGLAIADLDSRWPSGRSSGPVRRPQYGLLWESGLGQDPVTRHAHPHSTFGVGVYRRMTETRMPNNSLQVSRD
jgi:hypothetical protein